jgi:hypothetical protein
VSGGPAAGAVLDTAPGHQAAPVEGSWYCERTTWPANLRAWSAYPVIAVCRRCHGRIRMAERGQPEWAHVATAEGA